VLVVSTPSVLVGSTVPFVILTVSPGCMRATDSERATDLGTQPPSVVLMKGLTHLYQGPGSSVEMNSTVLAAWLAGTTPNMLQANSATAPIAD
jgi:hypothetical protein